MKMYLCRLLEDKTTTKAAAAATTITTTTTTTTITATPSCYGIKTKTRITFSK